MHVRDDVCAVDVDALTAGGSQGHVQDSPVLGDVDLVPAEHRGRTRRQLGLLGERDQQPHRLFRDPVLGVVGVQPYRLEAQPLGARGVRGEEVAQVGVPDRCVVRLQLPPGCPLTQRDGGHSGPPALGLLLVVPAELLAHRGQDLVGVVVEVAGRETRVERRGEHRGGHPLVDGRDGCPSALAGVGDMAGELGQVGGSWSADAVRSRSQEPTTLPRRQTSATAGMSMSYW